MSEPVLIPNSAFLGRGYDVVDMDPLNLGETSKSENLIALDVSDGPTRTTPDGGYTLPAGVHHVGIFSMSWETQSSVISSAGEFQREFKLSVEADAGVEGLFEFSGSKSRKEITRQAESRKESFVYSRASQLNHRLSLDLDNPKAPLAVTGEFADAVADLAPPDAEDWVERCEALVKRFGTHFTTEIVLGGLAFQRTSGSSRTFLKSSESEETLKTHAGVQIKALKAGAGVEQSTSLAAKTDAENHLERTALEFRGGDGSPSGIDDSWIHSLHERPAIVKAKLNRISTLLTERFFPNDEFIHDKRLLLDRVISSWIASKGAPGCGTVPLRHGEPLVLILPWNDGKTLQTPMLSTGGELQYPVRQGEPVRDSDESVAVAFESVDGRKAGAAVLAGDVVRLKHLGRNAYLSQRPGGFLCFEGDANKAVGLAVLHRGDNPFSPSRIGEFVLETDPIVLVTGRPGAPGNDVGIDASRRSLVCSNRPYQAGDSLVGFHFKRCRPPGDDDEGAPASLVTG